MKRIEITVSTTGESTVQTHGFQGGECRDASKFIEKALGKQVGEKLTGEFYQTARQRNSIEERS